MGPGLASLMTGDFRHVDRTTGAGMKPDEMLICEANP